jgi:hypothetical protein
MSNGFKFFDGPSTLDGQPIYGILTGTKNPSVNPKTGDMHQAWFLLQAMKPRAAVDLGLDTATCGQCPLRGNICYVNLDQAPRQVRQYETDKGYALEPDYGKRNVPIRLGAYGDPASVPFETIQTLIAGRPGHTGYTHQWKTCDPRFKSILMASVDSEAEAAEAQALGWRTFRVDDSDNPTINANEIACPASKESGYLTTCDRCQLCAGADKVAKSVVIKKHGNGK